MKYLHVALTPMVSWDQDNLKTTKTPSKKYNLYPNRLFRRYLVVARARAFTTTVNFICGEPLRWDSSTNLSCSNH